MTATRPRYILTLSCPERVGILARLGHFLEEHEAYAREIAHFGDQSSCRFLFRADIELRSAMSDGDKLERDFAALADELEMTWSLRPAHERPRLLVLVSQHGHCLNDLMYHQRSGLLSGDVVAVGSNHQTFRRHVEWHDLPFHYLPITPETKAQQEDELDRLIAGYQADYIILARYMQILSDEFTARHHGRIVNIHHALLPSFKGANPYRRAWERGVKMIGATAHFATANLDEGPIIEQGVERVDHKQTPEDLTNVGRNIERTVLTRAVNWVCEQRVLLDGQRTVVFR